ncbi:YiiX/YebB-like N1pC/P60 family cysteine hydrolase [Pantoea sp. M_5]|uniref:YiiX/YebB-like N1pC/P60 family cysteine hydrolase n=1 Tax=Pantoea sp. M_5 TaxID=2608038 RepID=UPI001232BC37|nr:YiiX/YebB-like N1pC/P60 family cysteine hydrolase [Pantoea sp. M_5]KAA5996868.1 hypothetical protein F3I50_12760 [Pantoea sp. M_5]
MDAVTDIRKKYVLNLAALKPGDIILEHGYKAHSLAIMRITGSHYSHAMLYEGSTIIEATSGGGVFSKIPNRFAVVEKNDLKVLRLSDEVEPSQIENITIFSRTLVGSKYDKSEAIKAGKKKKPSKAIVTGQFCSRLVAQCYYHAGIALVENINYCSPADIEKSTLLVEVVDAVKEASEEELAHALAANYHQEHLKNTANWVKAAKKILRKSGIEAETINDIYHATLRLRKPKVDKLILKEIVASGHYEFYLKDKISNPHRYDVNAFSKKVNGNIEIIEGEIHKEISIVKTHSTNLETFKKYHESYPSKLMLAEVNLYSNLLNITKERLEVIVESCHLEGLNPTLLPQALSMINYIENLQ